MAITLKIDTQALRELFPEGSEVRLDLQRAVLANFTREVTGRALTSELRQEITDISREAATSKEARAAVAELVSSPTSWSAVMLTSRAREIVKTQAINEARDAIGEYFADEARKAIESALGEFEQRINPLIDRNTKAAVAKFERDAVSGRINAGIKAAMNVLGGEDA